MRTRVRSKLNDPHHPFTESDSSPEKAHVLQNNPVNLPPLDKGSIIQFQTKGEDMSRIF